MKKFKMANVAKTGATLAIMVAANTALAVPVEVAHQNLQCTLSYPAEHPSGSTLTIGVGSWTRAGNAWVTLTDGDVVSNFFGSASLAGPNSNGFLVSLNKLENEVVVKHVEEFDFCGRASCFTIEKTIAMATLDGLKSRFECVETSE